MGKSETSGDGGGQSNPYGGRFSIENQIDIHLNDFGEAEGYKTFSPLEILKGLRYVMEYRIKGGKMPHIDPVLAQRLLKVLIASMRKREFHRLSDPDDTPEAVLALELFGLFLKEVHEFSQAVVEVSPSYLIHSLDLGFWIDKDRSSAVRKLAATVISLLERQLRSYKVELSEFLSKSDAIKVKQLFDDAPRIRDFPDDEEPSLRPPGSIYPLPRLYTERDADKVAVMFESDINKGLTEERVVELREHYGINRVDPPPGPTVLKMLWDQIKDFMVLVLIIMCIIEFASREYDSGVVLLVVIVFNTMVGFSLEFRSNKAISVLNDMTTPTARVIRNSSVINLKSDELVPGDIVMLDEGDCVPADIRLAECFQLRVNESFITGESVPVAKNTTCVRGKTLQVHTSKCKCIAFMSSIVTSGRAKGVVVRTGKYTEIGNIGNELSVPIDKRSRLEDEIFKLGIFLVVATLILCSANALILVLYGSNIIDSIKVSVTLAVSIIPEGLVAIMTSTLFLSIRRMQNYQAIMKKVHLIETLGTASVVCCDKTGTLTRGDMSLEVIWTPDRYFYGFALDEHQKKIIKYADTELRENFDQSNHSSDEVEKIIPSNINDFPPALGLIILCSSMCNSATKFVDPKSHENKYVGDSTDAAILKSESYTNVNKELFCKMLEAEIKIEFSFDSDRKMMSVIYSSKDNSSGGESSSYVFVKGASEAVCSRCVNYIDGDFSPGALGEVLKESTTKKFEGEIIEHIKGRCDAMADKAIRVLAVAYKKISRSQADEIAEKEDLEQAESGLTFIGLLGITDPVRTNIESCIGKFREAGVRILMITGDHVATATSVAKKAGIYNPQNPETSVTMKGETLDIFSDERLIGVKPFPVVFARTSPSNKLKIVRCLQQSKEIVIMVGDGINDAPSIRNSDVGVSMCSTAAEITKQAADMILGDDRLSTLTIAIEEGRRVYDNIRKFLVYTLSCNTAEIILFLLTSSFNYKPPFNSIQILWANIIADIPPAMAIGIEKAEPDIMQRPPRSKNSRLIDKKVFTIIILQSFIIALPSFFIYIFADRMNIEYNSRKEFGSLSFACLTTLQMSQAIFSRSIFQSTFKVGIFGNRILIAAVILSMALMIIGIYVPGINTWLRFHPFNNLHWIIIAAFVLLQFVLIEIIKYYSKFFFPNKEV